MTSRWALRGARLPILAGVLVVASTAVATPPRWPARVDLYSEAVALDGSGARFLVPAGAPARYVLGTRVAEPTGGADAATLALAEDQLAWLAAGTLPGRGGPYADVVRQALLDLRTLTAGDAAVAGWSPSWRYVWPRDASFVAVAFARTGHVADAEEILAFLGRVQGPDGSFHARYLPDGSGTPDARGIQEDGPAWALWALAEVARVDPGAAARHSALLDRSAARLAGRAGVPAPSSDYWEVREHRLTLGIAAPTVAGLDAAAYLYGLRGNTARAGTLRAAAERTAGEVERLFGPHYPRHLGGDEVDAAVTFLLPPFQRRAIDGAAAAVARAPQRMMRPAGGVAPGEGWKDDGVSWTPETALFALAAAANGDRDEASRWLDWLAAHRTAHGAIPEKVLHDGSPAAVAPLAWSAALVVIAVDALG